MNKVLFTVTDESIVDILKDKGVSLVYPLSSFCVGLPVTFDISEISGDAFLFINRILDTRAVDDLEKILNDLPSNIKGIVFDDVSLIELLKNRPLQKIFFYNHFNTNYRSINAFFDDVDDIIVSSDITEEEIDEIISKASKKVSLYTFGLVSAFYSRRHLIENFEKHFDITSENPKMLNISNKKFLAYQNDYGTVLYHFPYFNGLRLKKKDVHYNFYFPVFLDKEKIINLLEDNLDGIDSDFGFLDTKTIYKVK